jgi:hypothetical protein
LRVIELMRHAAVEVHAVGRSLHADHVLDLPPGPEGEGVVACRPVDGGVVHREGADVNHAPPGLAFVDRLGFQMQLGRGRCSGASAG